MAKALRSLLRWPVIPILLLLLMTVTGITADWIAPHDPVNGDLADRVLPPFWGGETTIEKLVVEEVELGQGYRQIALDEARKTKGDVSLGDRLDELIMRLVDVILSLPPILVTLVAVVVVGQSLGIIVAVLRCGYGLASHE